MIPSIKGFIVQTAVDEIVELKRREVIKDLDEVEGLLPDALDMIETGCSPTLWYPMELHDNILRTLRDIAGDGRERYWVDLGIRNAEKIFDARSISVVIAGARAFGDRAPTALIRIASLAMNVGDWNYEGDGLRDFTVEVTEAASIPDSIRLSVQGFIGVLAGKFTNEPVVCESTRLSPDHFSFRGRLESLAGC